MIDDKSTKALFERLQRIETRIVRGFTELGVSITDDAEWCRIDFERKEVHLKGAGRSIKSIQLALQNAKVYAGSYYDVIVAGEKVGSVRSE